MPLTPIGAGRMYDPATGAITYAAYDDPQTAVNEFAGEETPEAPPAPTGGYQGGGGVVGGNPRSLYASMGGKKGTKMDFKEFKEWYRNQTQAAGMDLSQFLDMSEMNTSTIGDATYGPGASFSAGSDISSFLSPDYLSDPAQLHVLNQRLDSNYGSLDEAMNSLALGAGFAGVSQWNQNLGAGRGNLPPELLNASMQDIRYEPNAWDLTFNSLMEAKDPKARVAARNELVPDWAQAVDEALQGQVDINREGQTGIPFGFQLMADPNINYTDPTENLWEGAYPASLMSLHQNQAGEGAFAQGLSMEEIMRDLWPIMNAQNNRPAGSEAPFEAGLSFGSPVWDAEQGGYQRSPLMGFGTNFAVDPDLTRLEGIAPGEQQISELAGPGGMAGGLYNRWSAHGQPGTVDYNQRWQGTLSGANPDLTPADWGYGDQAMQNMDPQTRAALEAFVQGQEDEYWNYPLYAPWRNLPEEVRQRFMALIGSPIGPGGESTLTAGYG